MSFEPLSGGTKKCPIFTDGGACPDVSCTGRGALEPRCTVEPESLDFGSVPALIGQAERTFTITNSGGSFLEGTVSAPCSDYAIQGEAHYSLSAGESHTVTIRFAPAATGTRNCTIDTGSDRCADVGVPGSGSAPNVM